MNRREPRDTITSSSFRFPPAPGVDSSALAGQAGVPGAIPGTDASKGRGDALPKSPLPSHQWSGRATKLSSGQPCGLRREPLTCVFCNLIPTTAGTTHSAAVASVEWRHTQDATVLVCDQCYGQRGLGPAHND